METQSAAPTSLVEALFASTRSGLSAAWESACQSTAGSCPAGLFRLASWHSRESVTWAAWALSALGLAALLLLAGQSSEAAGAALVAALAAAAALGEWRQSQTWKRLGRVGRQ